MDYTKLSKYTLSLLSLLVIIGFAVVGLTIKTNGVWFGYLLILIGSIAFGALLHKEKNG
jgi:hypothetical protein